MAHRRVSKELQKRHSDEGKERKGKFGNVEWIAFRAREGTEGDQL